MVLAIATGYQFCRWDTRARSMQKLRISEFLDGITDRARRFTTIARSKHDSSWTPEKSQVVSCEHQNNPNIHHQSFPELVSEELEICADYDGYHRH